MILKEREIDPDIISPILGKPYRKPGLFGFLTPTGSTFYFVKEMKYKDGHEVDIPEDVKAIFQRYERGLLLFLNRSNVQYAIPLKYSEIESILLEKSEETTLTLESNTYLIRMICNPYSYESQKKYFEKLNLGTTFQCIDAL